MNDEKRKTSARQALAAYIAAEGMRNTPERLAILDAAIELGNRFTTADLSRRVAEKGLRVSRATIYNALALFRAAGIVDRRTALTPRPARTELFGVSEPGSVGMSLVCSGCGKRRAVRDASLARLLVAKRFASFSVSGIEVCISGLCSRCRSARNKKQRK